MTLNCIQLWPTLLAFILLASAQVSLAAELTRQQQVEVLNQALRAFDRGVELKPKQPDEAQTFFAEAAVKFEVLVDAGVRNGRLYYDLGNAYLQAGRIGQAIVNYRR